MHRVKNNSHHLEVEQILLEIGHEWRSSFVQPSEFSSGYITGLLRPHSPSTRWVRGLTSPFLYLSLENWKWREGGSNDDKLTIRVHAFCSLQTAHLS